MKSSKWMVGLLAIAIVLAMAPSSFAQISLVISNPASAGEIQTNHNAQTADPTSTGSALTISGELLASSNLTQTYLTVTYPGPITSSTSNYTIDGLSSSTTPAAGAQPANDPITFTGQSGLFSTAYITTFNGAKGTITVVLPGAAANSSSGSFQILGVHMDVNGLTAPVTGTVSLSSNSNGYELINGNTFTAITALNPGIASVTQGAVTKSGTVQTNGGTLLIFTNGSISSSTASFVIKSGCSTCWRTAAQSAASGVAINNGSNIRLTFTGIPSGVTLGISTVTSSSSFSVTSSVPNVTAPTSSNANANQVTFSPSGSFSLGSTLSLEVWLTATGTSTQTTAGSISVTATMAPVGTGYDSTYTPAIVDSTSVAAGYPQFTDAESTSLTIGTVTAATTTLLAPYVVSVGGFDTGIEIANTTSDPFGGAVNFGATPTNGTMTLNIYSDNSTRTGSASPITLSSSSTKIFGAGLDSSGNIDAGSVWTGSLTSDILPAAGVTIPSTGFFGYIFIQTNFIDAHGIELVYNGAGTSYGTPLLVVPPPSSTNNRSAPGSGAENLNN